MMFFVLTSSVKGKHWARLETTDSIVALRKARDFGRRQQDDSGVSLDSLMLLTVSEVLDVFKEDEVAELLFPHLPPC